MGNAVGTRNVVKSFGLVNGVTIVAQATAVKIVAQETAVTTVAMATVAATVTIVVAGIVVTVTDSYVRNHESLIGIIPSRLALKLESEQCDVVSI